jgi:hypothetical protein
MATTAPGTENPEAGKSETGDKRKSSCETRAPMMLCCPFVAVFCCMARAFVDCAAAMKRDAPKAG